jgi:translocation and assembly module TamB
VPILAGVMVTFALVVAGTLWLLANLDHRFVKGPVQRLLSELVGTEVRYEGLSVSPFSGLAVKDLVVATPAVLRQYAPALLRLDELRVPIELGALLSGNVVIPEVRGGAAEVTVVFTDDGRDSISELFPSTQEPEEPSTPLSQSLESLRDLPIAVGPVELAPIRLRAVEVAVSQLNQTALPKTGEIVRQTDLAQLGIFSDGIAFAPEPNASISVRPHGREEVVLAVEERAGDPATRSARLSPTIDLRLANGRSLTLNASAQLREQSLFPEFQQADSLLRLEARAEFDPTKARTTVDVETLDVLDSMVIAEVHANVQDAVPPQGGDEQEPGAPPFSVAHVEAEGAFDVPVLPWSLSWLHIDGLAGRFEVAELEVVPAGVTAGRATLEGTVKSAHYEDGSLAVAIDGASLNGALSAPEDPAQTFGALMLDASVDEVRVKERGFLTATVQKLATAVKLEDFGTQDSGMWRLKGTGSLTSSIERASATMKGAAATIKATLALQMDLANHHIAGSIPVESFSLRNVGQDPIKVRDAQIDFAAREPTMWVTTDGSPTVELTGSAERVSVGPGHFRAPRWSVKAKRTAIEKYAVNASVTADQVSWGKFRREPPTTFSLEAAVDTTRPAVDANAALAIAGHAPTRLSLQASHDAPTTDYDLDVVGTEAGPLLGALLFGDGGLRSDEFAFSLESHGAFHGLVSKNQRGELVLSEEPARTVRGSHRTELHVDHLSLLRFDLTHQIHDLTVTVSSSHEAPGKGAFDVTTSFARAYYGEREHSMSLHHYAQELKVAYAALHGAPSFVIETDGTLGKFEQPYLEQYPVANVSFGVDVEVDDTRVCSVREMYWRNPAGGTRFEARASYEGWSDAIRSTEVCSAGTTGCPEVASMYGREAAKVGGTFEQDFSFWRSTERTKSGGSLTVPFTIESGDLNTYRMLATAQFRDLVLELPQYGLLIEDLDALIPMDQEFATEPEFFVLPSKAGNAMAQMRFFDLYPFTERDSFFTVHRVQFGPEVIGPVAANLQVIGPAVAMDQIHAAYRDGFITGQFLADLSRDQPEVAFRGHMTGVEVEDGKGVLDANLAMTFIPTTLIVEGKVQVVRISKDHLYAIIDVLDPYHEDEDMNRVRLGLKFGYPKYVRINFDEGLMDTKIDLGGLAGAIRIDEIKGIPVTPFLEQYVQPYIERIFTPSLMYEEAPPGADGAMQVSERSGGRP